MGESVRRGPTKGEKRLCDGIECEEEKWPMPSAFHVSWPFWPLVSCGCVRVDKRPYLTSYECIVSACKLILSNLIRTISNWGLLMRQYRVYIEHTTPHNVTRKICDAENLQQQQLGEWAAVLWQHLFPFMHTHKLPATRVWVFDFVSSVAAECPIQTIALHALMRTVCPLMPAWK